MVAAAVLTCWSCDGRPRPDSNGPLSSPAPASRDFATDSLPPEVATVYEAARRAVKSGETAEARRQLQRAVELMPEFTEGWYNLGASISSLAIRAAGAGDDAGALTLFREAVAAKRRAQDLIREGKWFIYEGPERERVVHDLTEALREADEVLADESSLLIALRLYAERERSEEP